MPSLVRHQVDLGGLTSLRECPSVLQVCESLGEPQGRRTALKRVSTFSFCKCPKCVQNGSVDPEMGQFRAPKCAETLHMEGFRVSGLRCCGVEEPFC